MKKDGASFSQRERWALCDLLTELGPDSPTLCAGWRSADLAAHLLTRERRPDTAVGMVTNLGPFKSWTTRVRDGARDTETWDTLVSRVRSGPPPLLRPLDPVINTIEYFVHHEDLRRGQPDWQPRQLAAADEAELWRRAGAMAKLSFHPAAGRLEAPGLEPLVLSKKGGPTAKGPPGEVVMWLLGRKDAARVEIVA
jgi:uncharacterized protein (TIGR03085 family)